MATLQTLIAHYLATSYPSALPSFLSATGEPQPDVSNPPQPDLRTLAQDYLSHQLAKQLEGIKLERAQDGSWTGWTARDVVAHRGPERALSMAVDERGKGRRIEGLSVGNLLSVQVGQVPVRWFDTATASYRAESKSCFLVTSVDKTLSIVDQASGEVERILEPHKSSILSFALHPTKPRYLLTGSMDGSTVLTDLTTSQPVQTFKSSKFVVRVAFSPCGRYMATASYDRHVVLYKVSAGEHEGVRRRRTVGNDVNGNGDMDLDGGAGYGDSDGDDELDLLDETDDSTLACEPSLRYTEIHRIRVDHNPEAILFVPPPQTTPSSLASRSGGPEVGTNTGKDGWLLYTTRSSHLLHYLCPLTLSTRNNSFNAHPLDTHVSFSVLNMVLHPSGTVVACQTDGATAGERVLLYPTDPDDQERLGCIWTGSETDDYVLPRMAWTCDGSALVTTSPNGYLHLLPLSGGIRSLKMHGADGGGGEIIRDVCVIGDTAVSVGYDRVVRFTDIVPA